MNPDSLIKVYPERLELYRTRGIVRTFRDEYSAAVKDFTHALKAATGNRPRPPTRKLYVPFRPGRPRAVLLTTCHRSWSNRTSPCCSAYSRLVTFRSAPRVHPHCHYRSFHSFHSFFLLSFCSFQVCALEQRFWTQSSNHAAGSHFYLVCPSFLGLISTIFIPHHRHSRGSRYCT